MSIWKNENIDDKWKQMLRWFSFGFYLFSIMIAFDEMPDKIKYCLGIAGLVCGVGALTLLYIAYNFPEKLSNKRVQES